MVRNGAFLAPMAGITDRPMRQLAARYGAGLVVSEMIASAALSTGHHDMVRKLGRSEVCRIWCSSPAARWSGWRGPRGSPRMSGADIIDINFGCPAKRVTNGYAGSALMRVPDLAQRLVEAVTGATVAAGDRQDAARLGR